jgi:putative oxidoreductase
MKHVTRFAARVALAAGFLSAVADRFGLWGPPGAPHVAWGDWAHFVAQTATLNWFAPRAAVPIIAAVATLAEAGLAVLLLVGFRLRETALAAGGLLLLFALAMTAALGPKAPLDYSVFAASAAAFLLASKS